MELLEPGNIILPTVGRIVPHVCEVFWQQYVMAWTNINTRIFWWCYSDRPSYCKTCWLINSQPCERSILCQVYVAYSTVPSCCYHYIPVEYIISMCSVKYLHGTMPYCALNSTLKVGYSLKLVKHCSNTTRGLISWRRAWSLGELMRFWDMVSLMCSTYSDVDCSN